MGDWTTEPLECIAEIRSSSVDKKSNPAEEPVRLCNYMDVYSREYITDDIEFMEATATPAEIQRFGIERGDVMITKDSETPDDIGIPTVVVDDIPKLVCGYHVVLIKPNRTKVDPVYLAKQLGLSDTARYYGRLANGSTRYGLSYQSVARTPIPLAPLPQQQRIAEILSTVDEAIEQTEALIAKTQQIKAGLTQDLFTRGVTADGRLRPPPEEAPQLYKESPLGWLPREWQQGMLERWLLAPPKNGYSPREVDHWTGQLMLGLGCLTSDGFSPRQLKYAPDGDPKVAAASLTEGDVLISRANTRELVGLAGMYHDVGHPCSYPDLMMRLRPSVEMDARFLELSLRAPLVRRQIQANAVGTSSSMVKISGQIVRRLEVALPDKNEQERIVDIEDTVQRRLKVEQHYVGKLLVMKAGLMQDLLTGQVPVAAETAPETEVTANV